jgi:hypothetical protein
VDVSWRKTAMAESTSGSYDFSELMEKAALTQRRYSLCHFSSRLAKSEYESFPRMIPRWTS